MWNSGLLRLSARRLNRTTKGNQMPPLIICGQSVVAMKPVRAKAAPEQSDAKRPSFRSRASR